MLVRKKIVVTGSGGQLGMELKELALNYPLFEFLFTTREDFPLDDAARMEDYIRHHQPQYLVNCAAYTLVDKAESDPSTANAINAIAPGVLAAACRKTNTAFIHISTDYVFDGLGKRPYKETDTTVPVNAYGDTKLQGEKNSFAHNSDTIVLRTAWVYSAYGKNFVKTMLRLMEDRPQINVVNDQFGAPTYAADLAEAIMHIINGQKWVPGIYHYSNKGTISWYDFARQIAIVSGSKCEVQPIDTAGYPTPAKRPAYSVLDTSLISATFGIPIKEWKESLAICVAKIKNAPAQ